MKLCAIRKRYSEAWKPYLTGTSCKITALGHCIQMIHNNLKEIAQNLYKDNPM